MAVRSDETRGLLVDKPTLAAMLNISVRTIDRLNSSRQIPAPLRLGARLRWRRAEILAWM
jgi:predicted DNA-binding transcriptional regulator AlpA